MSPVSLIQQSEVTVRVLGTTPLYLHRLGAKARKELMLGGNRKKPASTTRSLKHDPAKEYVDAMHLEENWHPHTSLFLPAQCFKGAMATAAVDIQGLTKSGIQRQLFLPDEKSPVFGIPKLRCDIVRNSGVARTPDVRTRPCLEKWGAELRIRFCQPLLSTEDVVTLIRNAGMLIGVGDYRQEKGRGSYGCFDVIPGNGDFPPELLDRDAQMKAIKSPEPYDVATEQLLDEYHEYLESIEAA